MERLGREQDRPHGASRLAKEPSRVEVREGSGAPAARAADVVMLAEMLPVAREQKLRADLADLKPVPGRSVARSPTAADVTSAPYERELVPSDDSRARLTQRPRLQSPAAPRGRSVLSSLSLPLVVAVASGSSGAGLARLCNARESPSTSRADSSRVLRAGPSR